MSKLYINKGTPSVPDWTEILDEDTYGIADNKTVQIDSADVADNDIAKFTANGLEGRTYAELKTDLDLEAGTDFPSLTTFNDHSARHEDTGDDEISLTNLTGTKIYFYDAGGEHIAGDGTDLTISSGAAINLTATTDVVIPANVGVTFGTGEKIEGDSTDLTVTSGGAINLTATTDVVIPANVGVTFGTGEKIEGDSTDLTVTSGGAINLTATTDVVIPANVGITFGTGEKIEGDSTDLTVTSGAKINLTATSDVVVPVSVGIILGDGAEKIESDNTDLTINSGGDIALTATADVNIPANIGLKFGDDGEGIEGDGTDLTITSGDDIILTATGDVKLYSAGDLIAYSDAGSTEVARIDGATGNITTEGTVDGVDVADHDARHAWGGADQINTKDLIMAHVSLAFFECDGGTTNTVDGSGVNANTKHYIDIYTDTTNLSHSGSIFTSSHWFDKDSNNNWRFSFMLRSNLATDKMEAWFGMFAATTTFPTTTSNHVGVKLVSTGDGVSSVLSATNGDGATETATQLIGEVGASWDIFIYIKYMADNIKYYYSTDAGSTWTLGATHTTNRPDDVNLYLGAWVYNTEAVNKRVRMYWPKVLMGVE